jgi:hypothetical protein
LSSSADPSQPGQSITLTAHVSIASGTASGIPAGSVYFVDGNTVLDVVTLNASGDATYSTAALASGPHGIFAYFGGTSLFGHSKSPVLVQLVQRSCGDLFADATAITGSGGAMSGSNALATGEAGEPDPTGTSKPLHSVWCRWTAPADGQVTFSTFGSRFDTTLGVYTGTSLTSLTLVAANDNAISQDNDAGASSDGEPGTEAGEGKLSRVTFTATRYTVYMIVVDGAAGATGDYVLNWSQPVNKGELVAAVLPTARSAVVGVPTTAFATMLNLTNTTATGCNIQLPPGYPADIFYQAADSNNLLLGSQNTPVDIPAHSYQRYVFGVTPISTINSGEVALVFTCSNAGPAPTISGVNTLKLTADQMQNADVVAIGATVSNDGILAGQKGGTGIFAAAAINIGAAAPITVSVDDDGHKLPVTISLCQTNSSTGACTNPATPAAAVTSTLATNAVATYSIFVRLNDTISFDPANNRLIVRFRTADGVLRGATSIAIRAD